MSASTSAHVSPVKAPVVDTKTVVSALRERRSVTNILIFLPPFSGPSLQRNMMEN